MSSAPLETGLKLLSNAQLKTIDQELVRQVFQRNSLVRFPASSPPLDDAVDDNSSTSSRSINGSTNTTVAYSPTDAARITPPSVNDIQHRHEFDLTLIPNKIVPIMPSQEQVKLYEDRIRSMTIAELENTTVGKLLENFSRSRDLNPEHNSKNMFITDFVKAVLRFEISLDIAIVCVDGGTESSLLNMLRLCNADPNRVKMATFEEVLKRSKLYGVMMKFRKSGKRAKPIRRPEVDFIMVYDPSAFHPTFISGLDQIFEGITYSPPQKVYLLNMFTPEMRCFLLDQALQNKTIDWKTRYAELNEAQRRFIFKLPNYHPGTANEWMKWSRYVATDVVDWAQEMMNVNYKFNFPPCDSLIYRVLINEEQQRRKLNINDSKAKCLHFPHGLTKKVYLEELREMKRREIKEQVEKARRAAKDERQRKEAAKAEQKRKEHEAEKEKQRIDAANQKRNQQRAEEQQRMLFRKQLEERHCRVEQFNQQRRLAEHHRQQQISKVYQQQGAEQQQHILAIGQLEKQKQMHLPLLNKHTEVTTPALTLEDTAPSPTPSVSTSSSSSEVSHLSSTGQEISLTAPAKNQALRRFSPTSTSPGSPRSGGKYFLTSFKKSKEAAAAAAAAVGTPGQQQQRANEQEGQIDDVAQQANNNNQNATTPNIIVTPTISSQEVPNESSISSLPASSLQQEHISTIAAMAKHKRMPQVIPAASNSTESISSESSVEAINTKKNQALKRADVTKSATSQGSKRKSSAEEVLCPPVSKVAKISPSFNVASSNAATAPSPPVPQQEFNSNSTSTEDVDSFQRAFDTSFLHDQFSKILEELDTL